MKRYFVTCLILFMTNVAIAEPNYYFADSNCRLVESKKYSGVTKESKEKIVLGHNDRYNYDYYIVEVVVSLCAPYEKAQSEITETCKKRFGIKSTKDFVERDYWEKQVRSLESIGGRDIAEKNRKGFAELEQRGLSTRQFLWQRIETEKYNVKEDIKGYSKLRIDIIDGNSIFGRPCTLIAITRTDYWRDWYRLKDSFVYLPIKGEQSIDIITKTEIELLEELEDRMGHKESMKLFTMSSYYRFPLDDPSLVFKLKEVIDQCNDSVKSPDSKK